MRPLTFAENGGGAARGNEGEGRDDGRRDEKTHQPGSERHAS